MSVTVTQTKIHIPRRREGLLSRPRLIAVLDDALDYPLLLIAAPAGYGKTSLMIDLAHQAPYPVCWYTLDDLDRDPQRFLTHLISAIRVQFPDCGEGFLSLIENQPDPKQHIDQLAATLANDLYQAIQEHFLIFLDDFHLIAQQPVITEFIRVLANKMDDNAHIAIASRKLISLPGLPLLIGRRMVKAIDADDLCFQPEEIKAFLEMTLDQPFSIERSQELYASTEGWITGLLLMSHPGWKPAGNQAKAVKVSGTNIQDYFHTQVMNSLSPEIRELMVITAQLDEIHPALCRDIFGECSGIPWTDFISTLVKSNLFVEQVDTDQPWVRYHPLFREYLLDQFEQLEKARQVSLRRRLFDWHLRQENWERAFVTAQLLEDEELLARVIDQASSPLFHAGRIRLLSEWLEFIPVKFYQKEPYLLSLKGFIQVELGKVDEGIENIARSISNENWKPGENKIGKSHVWMATANRFIGNYNLSLNSALTAYKITCDSKTDQIIKAESAREIGLAYSRLGDNEKALSHLLESSNIYKRQGKSINAAQSEMDIGYIMLSVGHLEDANSYFQSASKVWKSNKNYYQLALSKNNIGYLSLLSGNYLLSHKLLSQSLEFSIRVNSPRLIAFSTGSLGDLSYSLQLLNLSVDYYEKALVLATDINDRFLKTYYSISLSSIHRNFGSVDLSKNYLRAVQDSIVENSKEHAIWLLEKGFLDIQTLNIARSLENLKTSRSLFTLSKNPFGLAKSLLGLILQARMAGDQAELDAWLGELDQLLPTLETLQPLLPEVIHQIEPLREIANQSAENARLLELLKAAEVHLASLPRLQRQIFPNQDSAADPDLLTIQALGGLQVQKGGEKIRASEWIHQKTVRELFYYLLSQRSGVTKEQVGLEFWPESSPDLLSCQFKNAVYRLRRALGKETVLYDRESRVYRFNRGIPYSYDVESFRSACQKAEREPRPTRKLELYREAVALYRHPFGPQLEGVWAEPVRRKLYLLYEKAIIHIAENFFTSGDYQACVNTCRNVLENEPDHEKAVELCMQSLSRLGNKTRLRNEYQLYTSYLLNNYGIDPPKRISNLFRKLNS